MNLRAIIFSIILVLLGLILYFSGVSMSNNIFNLTDLVSGSYLVVFGIFLMLAGSLIFAAQIYRGH